MADHLLPGTELVTKKTGLITLGKLTGFIQLI